MQVDPRDLQAVLDIAGRAPMSVAEARLLAILTDKWNAQQKRGENSDNRSCDTGGAGTATEPGE